MSVLLLFLRAALSGDGARARAWDGPAHSHISADALRCPGPRASPSRSAHDTLCPCAADNMAMNEEAQEEEGNAHHEAGIDYSALRALLNGADIAADNMAAQQQVAKSRKTRADGETCATHHAERAMQGAVSVLDEVANPERNLAPSQQPHPAWILDLLLRERVELQCRVAAGHGRGSYCGPHRSQGRSSRAAEERRCRSLSAASGTQRVEPTAHVLDLVLGRGGGVCNLHGGRDAFSEVCDHAVPKTVVSLPCLNHVLRRALQDMGQDVTDWDGSQES